MMMLVMVLGTAIAFSSCSKDDEEDLQASLKGTKWTVTYLGALVSTKIC